MVLIVSIITAIAGLGLKLWLAMRQSTARMLGRAETREAQATETLKSAKEAADERDKVNKLPSDAVDDKLRRWSKAGDC